MNIPRDNQLWHSQYRSRPTRLDYSCEKPSRAAKQFMRCDYFQNPSGHASTHLRLSDRVSSQQSPNMISHPSGGKDLPEGRGAGSSLIGIDTSWSGTAAAACTFFFPGIAIAAASWHTRGSAALWSSNTNPMLSATPLGLRPGSWLVCTWFYCEDFNPVFLLINTIFSSP
jgi:hypothetical protein